METSPSPNQRRQQRQNNDNNDDDDDDDDDDDYDEKDDDDAAGAAGAADRANGYARTRLRAFRDPRTAESLQSKSTSECARKHRKINDLRDTSLLLLRSPRGRELDRSSQLFGRSYIHKRKGCKKNFGFFQRYMPLVRKTSRREVLGKLDQTLWCDGLRTRG
ncbi:hypothetical protein V1477_020265 [Vespula maculifrons]|uniref:Uncharacterized protein n=1 Tax=Vespula maculifrons TaxID=7453 RepID=A0ABD2AP79_VESMC